MRIINKIMLKITEQAEWQVRLSINILATKNILASTQGTR